MNRHKKSKKYVRQHIEKEKHKTPKTNYFNKIFVNVLFGFMFFLLLSLLSSKNSGYKWVWNNLIKGNINDMKAYKHLSTSQKNEIRHGFFFTYLNFINNNTPENAIILMPSASIIDQVDEKYKLQSLKNTPKTTYFIYPRRVVYDHPENDSDSTHTNKVTHIAIVNYHGYDKLDYTVDNKKQFDILP